jgi:hypothetical protein
MVIEDDAKSRANSATSSQSCSETIEPTYNALRADTREKREILAPCGCREIRVRGTSCHTAKDDP